MNKISICRETARRISTVTSCDYFIFEFEIRINFRKSHIYKESITLLSLLCTWAATSPK